MARVLPALLLRPAPLCDERDEGGRLAAGDVLYEDLMHQAEIVGAG